MNDLITRVHVDQMLIEADAREEYHDWLNTLGPDDDTPELDAYVSEITSPIVQSIEDNINATIERQIRIAARKGISLDEYREQLADRRDILMDDLLHSRIKKV